MYHTSGPMRLTRSIARSSGDKAALQYAYVLNGALEHGHVQPRPT